MESIRKLLAQRIKQLRNAKDWNQEKLAERAKLAKTHIGHIETGRRWPSPKVLEAIAMALEVDSAALFQDPDFNPLITPEQALKVISDALSIKRSL